IKENDIGWDRGVRGEYAVRQPHNCVDVKFLQKLLFDTCADASSREYAIRHYDRCPRGAPCGRRLTMQLPHDELEKQQSGLSRLAVLWKIPLNTFLFLSAKRRVGQDYVNALLLADLGKFEPQGVAGIDLRRIEPVQEQVHLPEEIWKRFR